MSGSDGIALPLSAAQREVWFAEQRLGTGNRVYKLGEYIEIYGPIDPAQGPLFSYALIKLGPDRFLWYHSYHHIVMDMCGFSLIARRVAELYTTLAQGWASDQNACGSLLQLLECDSTYRASEQFAQDRKYWTERFADRPEPVRFVGRSSGTPESCIQQTSCWSASGVDRLQVAARRAGVRWSRMVIAATAVYVHRLTGAWDVVVGVPVTARQDPVLKRAPGMVSNVLPLRLSLRPDMSHDNDLTAHQQRFLNLLETIAITDPDHSLSAPTAQLLPGTPLTALAGQAQLTHATLPPSMLAALPAEDGLPAAMTLIVAGEACPSELVATWSPGRRMINAYGPTETTVCATMSGPLSNATHTPPPIGRRVAGGISAPGPHRSGREPLDSSGSCRPVT
ncbi:MAG: AMP-binding protein, partial [Pseudonocardiales bacterium]|nr:AMP-binding protein [Pseudonocardiales bacterium]